MAEVIPGRSRYASRTYVSLVALAVIIACSAGLGVYTRHQAATLRDGQVEACHRGNVLRRESNRRIRAHLTDRDNLVAFAHAARVVRLQAYRNGHQSLDLEAARLYLKIVRAEARIRFEPVTIVNCEEAIPKP